MILPTMQGTLVQQVSEGSISARFVRWQMTATGGGFAALLSEFYLLLNGTPFFSSSISETNTYGTPGASHDGYPSYAGEACAVVFDPSIEIKWDAGLGNVLTFDAYDWATGDATSFQGVPNAWILEISPDGITWTTIDTKSIATPTASYTFTGPYNL